MLSIWNAHSAKEVHRLLVKGLVGAFRGLTIFSPDGQRLAVGETDGSVRLLEVGTWKELLRFPAHQEGITALVFCRKGEFLVSGSGYTDLTLRVWDLAKGAPDATLTGHSAWIGGLALSPDGNTLASAAGDQSVRLWDVADWKEIVVLRGHSDEVAAVAFSPDGRTLASGSRDGSVLLWDASRRQKSTARFTFPAKLTRVEVLEDGTNAVTLDERNRLSRWNVATGEETPLLTLTNKFLAFSPGGQLFLLNRASQTVEAWDLLPPPPRLVFTVPVGEVEENPVFFMSLPLALYSDDRGSLALGGLSNGIQLISLKRPQQPVRLQVQKGRAWPASFADRGRRLATGNGQETLTLWDLERHQPIASLELPGLDRVRRLSWDGRWLARGFRDEIKVYNLDGAAQPPLRLAHGGIISDIAFSPDGSVLASASEEGLVKLWNLPSGSLRVTLRAALTGVHGLAFSPDGRRLATGSGGREAVRIWDLATAQEVATLGAEGSLFRARFSRDGNTIVAEAMAERIWYAWHAPSLAEIAAVEKTPAASPPTR
jgi:WD40 repeat protein